MTDKATDNDYYVIDLLYLAKCVWHRAWIVVLATIAAAAIGFAYSAFIIQPKYSSSILLYVNNSSISVGNTSFSISSSEITAAQSLVKTLQKSKPDRGWISPSLHSACLCRRVAACNLNWDVF